MEDPVFATAGVIYLGHIWFISVFSINIFLDLYGKNRTDFCKLDSHGDLVCGIREPWVAEVFNAIPWIMTGVLIWILVYLGIRWFLVNSIGARLTPTMGKQISIGALVVAVMISAWSWPIYNNGFWDANGLGAMEDIEELEKMRSQPSDTHLHAANEFSTPYPDLEVPASDWLEWSIFQPTQKYLIDFANENGHQQPESGLNAAGGEGNYSGHSPFIFFWGSSFRGF